MATSDPTSALLREAVRRLAPVLPLLTELGSRFVGAGHEIALVGGPVRDAFLGRVSPDLDFNTSASPEQTHAILARWADANWDAGRPVGPTGARKGVRSIGGTESTAAREEHTTHHPACAFAATALRTTGRPRTP